jgi:hypothetical protein
MSRSVPSNTDEVVDTRTIQERIDELQELVDEFNSQMEEFTEKHKEWEDNPDHDDDDEPASPEPVDSDDLEELRVLTALKEEAEGYCDWDGGEALIKDSYGVDYAQELADDLGYLGDGKPNHWPFTCLDWDRAWEELKDDYTPVDWDGEEYWVRCC